METAINKKYQVVGKDLEEVEVSLRQTVGEFYLTGYVGIYHAKKSTIIVNQDKMSGDGNRGLIRIITEPENEKGVLNFLKGITGCEVKEKN
jgi:hypothetical protein